MTTIIKGDFSRQTKKLSGKDPAEKPAPLYQLKISLAFTDPLIWRRVQVPGQMSIARLHDIFQFCMGWKDLHAHRFLIGKVFYAPSDDVDLWAKTGERNESEYRLTALEPDIKFCFTYLYDFGDGWEHQIDCEERIAAADGPGHPVLLAGEHACPPENVGGVPGYEEFLTIINAPQHTHHRRMAQWLGADHFDPAYLDIDGINAALKKMR
ncbi:MAG: plasmid pRiA4b ORF-3 family protein [Desulfocapsaceae bacterium]|nr:plasmid pRiA4b ORF-3 family protein [Desulfocapsaceae bacterium]